MADPAAAVEYAGSDLRAWLIPRPGLFELRGSAARVLQVSAPAGSGKTFLPADQPPRAGIAGELFVSLNTIRTHMRNLYSKLGVHSRADAVKRARELGLLSPSSLTR